MRNKMVLREAIPAHKKIDVETSELLRQGRKHFMVVAMDTGLVNTSKVK